MGKVFTLAEVSKHNTVKDLWLIIDGKVYDVTKYTDEHPGGDDVLVRAAGRDATDDFEDVGHSTTARAMMDEYYVGEIDTSTLSTNPSNSKTNEYVPPSEQQSQYNSQDKTSSGSTTKLLPFVVPLLILGVGIGIRFYTKSA